MLINYHLNRSKLFCHMIYKTLLSLVALLFFSTVMVSGQSLEIPLITVEGTAIIYVSPDEVLLNLTIDKKATELVEARRLNEVATKKAIYFLKSKGLEDKHIQTQYMSIGPRYKPRSNEIEYYTSSQTISICLNDLTKYDTIVDGLLLLGVDRLGNPTFRSTKAKEVKDQARRKAIVKAKEKAELLASTLKQKVGVAKFIKEVSNHSFVNTRSYANSVESATASDSEGLSFAPGQIQIKAVVEVSFELL